MKSNLGKAMVFGIIAMIIIFGGIIGISRMAQKPAPEKPFTITSKLPYPDGNCKFEYYDFNERQYEFTDRCEKYSVGDVIE